ncbi:Meiosis-specific protein ASY1-like protein, partial [Drosera capensis]
FISITPRSTSLSLSLSNSKHTTKTPLIRFEISCSNHRKCLCEGCCAEGEGERDHGAGLASSVSLSYSDSDSQEVSMNISRSRNKKQGGTFKRNSTGEVTSTQMRSSACKLIRALLQLMRTLDKMPEEPEDYEPPYFRCCTTEEGYNQWTKNPLKMEVGNVNSKHFVLALKVKSVLDPCDNDAEDDHVDNVSFGADSVQRDDSSDTESELCLFHAWLTFYVWLADPQQPCEEDTPMEQDDTQDPEEDEKQLCRGRDWISSCHRETVEITDVLSNFPDISMALYHALPMDYVSVAKLQNKLEGEANQYTVRKLIDKMTRDGFVEAQSNRRHGKRVIHSDLAGKKLREVKGTLDLDAQAMDINGNDPCSKLNLLEFHGTGMNHLDASTCGGLHSIGSDLTRTRSRSEAHQNGSPIASLESTVPKKDTLNGNSGHGDDLNNLICSRSSQDKQSRKTSMFSRGMFGLFVSGSRPILLRRTAGCPMLLGRGRQPPFSYS